MTPFALRTLIFGIAVILVCAGLAVRWFLIGKKDNTKRRWMPFAASAFYTLSALFLTGFALVAYEVI